MIPQRTPCATAPCRDVAGAVTGILHTVFEIPAILAGILTQISLWSINLRIMGGKRQSRRLLESQDYLSASGCLPWMTRAQASMIVIVLAVALFCFLLVLRTEIGSAMRDKPVTTRIVVRDV